MRTTNENILTHGGADYQERSSPAVLVISAAKSQDTNIIEYCLGFVEYLWVRFAFWVLWVRPAVLVGSVGSVGYMG